MMRIIIELMFGFTKGTATMPKLLFGTTKEREVNWRSEVESQYEYATFYMMIQYQYHSILSYGMWQQIMGYDSLNPINYLFVLQRTISRKLAQKLLKTSPFCQMTLRRYTQLFKFNRLQIPGKGKKLLFCFKTLNLTKQRGHSAVDCLNFASYRMSGMIVGILRMCPWWIWVSFVADVKTCIAISDFCTSIFNLSPLYFFFPGGKGENGNAIWKNRLESWKDKKNPKKKDPNMTVTESETPLEQQIEEKQ